MGIKERFKKAFRAGQKVGRFSECSLYVDFQKGVEQMQQWMSHAPENAFYKVEKIRLHYRRTHVQRKLCDAYYLLGVLVMDSSMQNAPPISREEYDRMDQRIRTLLEDQKRIEAEIEELHASLTPSHGE